MKKKDAMSEDVTSKDTLITKDMFRMNRRTFVKVAGATVGVLALGKLNLIPNVAGDTPTLGKFVDPLISAIPKLIPDTKKYKGKDYYEIYMAEGKFQFSSQLPVTALSNTTWGYGSNYNQEDNNNKNKTKGIPNNVFLGYLGPTIEATKGRPVVVKFINNLPTTHPLEASIDPTVPDPLMYPGLVPGRATPHLHGGFTDPRFDGHPHSWFTAGGVHGSNYKTLPGAASNEAIIEYSNEQPAANLWYHDHAMGITRLNAYVGLAALYYIRDKDDSGLTNNKLGLPAEKYEIPLVIQDKQFNSDGSLFYPTEGVTDEHPKWVPEFFGDTAVVNAQTFPFLNVEPRRYRFRMLNGSQARFYNLWIEGAGSVRLPLWVIGMEQSLLSAPVKLQQILLSPAERADVIVDFTGFAPGTTFIMKNDALAPYPGDVGVTDMPEIMQFKVIAPLPESKKDKTELPANLVLPSVTPLVPTPGAPVREIVLKETIDTITGNPTEVRLNQKYFSEPVDETPKVGTSEIWQFINLTVDAHPMHMHLVKFQVVNRQNFDAAAYTTDYLAWVAAGRVPASKPVLANYLSGAPLPPAPEESGWKDTAKAYPGQILRVISKFDLPPKVSLPADYVYHCHILEHEENEMMRPFQVVP